MRRLLTQSEIVETGADTGVASQAAQDSPRPRRNPDTAFELLDRAAQAFEVLISRCQRIEQEFLEATDRAEAQANESAATIEQWRQIASTLKDQLESADRKNAALKSRCDAAEARAGDAQARLKLIEKSVAQADERATTAEDLSTKLHDKVVLAFGIGSPIHAVFDAIKTPAG